MYNIFISCWNSFKYIRMIWEKKYWLNFTKQHKMLDMMILINLVLISPICNVVVVCVLVSFFLTHIWGPDLIILSNGYLFQLMKTFIKQAKGFYISYFPNAMLQKEELKEYCIVALAINADFVVLISTWLKKEIWFHFYRMRSSFLVFEWIRSGLVTTSRGAMPWLYSHSMKVWEMKTVS